MMGKFLPACAAALALALGPAHGAEKADLVLVHGRILTMDARDSMVHAIAVTGGRIIATGSDQKILALAAKGTQVIDLGGLAATPGLIATRMRISADNGGRSVEQIEAEILRAFEALHGAGFTAMRDSPVTARDWEAYRALLTADQLTERVCVLWRAGTTLDPAEEVPSPPKSLGDGRLISCGAELAMDGAAVDPAVPFTWASIGASAKDKPMTVPVRDFLLAHTRQAAPLLFLGDTAGSLEKGRRADIAIWDRDPYRIKPEQLKDMKCLMTLLDGEVIYRTDRAPIVSKR